MYHADTTTGVLNAYRYGDTAQFDRTVRRFAPGEGWPDGACVDSAGYIWQALWSGGALICLDPEDGREIDRVTLPASQITCSAFGGANFDVIAVTSASTSLDEDRRGAEPEAGNVFFARTGVCGVAEMRVQIE